MTNKTRDELLLAIASGLEVLDPKIGAVPKIGFEQNQTEQDKP